MALAEVFKACAVLYDQANDRHERLVKISRDLTVASKRYIFLLHRVSHESAEAREAQVSSARVALISQAASLLVNVDEAPFYRHHRAFSPGVQEFIESMTFDEFLRSGELLTLDKLHAELYRLAPREARVKIDLGDYLLGIADLTGELMRLAVNSAGRGRIDTSRTVCTFLQRVQMLCSTLPADVTKEWPQKMNVLNQSVAKCEKLSLSIQLRQHEYPPEKIAEYFSTNELS